VACSALQSLAIDREPTAGFVDLLLLLLLLQASRAPAASAVQAPAAPAASLHDDSHGITAADASLAAAAAAGGSL